MLVVNTNLYSLNAQRVIKRSENDLITAMQRISSGLRVNSAKDDSAGLSTIGRMTTQIKSLSVAIKNAGDGISFVQTVEGALQDVTGLLQRIQELAVQAINPSNSALDRALLQGEVAQLNQEITRISEETEFNGRSVLTGNVINAKFQIGIRAEQTIKVSVSSTVAARIGNHSTSSDSIGEEAIGAVNVSEASGEAPTNRLRSQIITIRGFNSGVNPPTITLDDGETAKSIAAKINALEERSGVSATAKTRLTLSDIYDPGEDPNDPTLPANPSQTVSFYLYGTNAKSSIDPTEKSNAAEITAEITGGDREGLAGLVDAINAKVATTGIKATFIDEDGTIELTHDTGENISIEEYTNNAIDPGNTITLTGLEDTEPVTLEEETEEDSATVGGIITLNSAKIFSVASDADEDSSLFSRGFQEAFQTSSLTTLSEVSVATVDGAASALQVATGALEFINSLRGDLGAIQNRFEATISNLESVLENTQAARSRIEDADFAAETAKLTKAQILQQAGIAVLAQANAIPQTVLALLRA